MTSRKTTSKRFKALVRSSERSWALEAPVLDVIDMAFVNHCHTKGIEMQTRNGPLPRRQLDAERFIVKASSGPRYVVTCKVKLDKSKLVSGSRVSLDMTTLTIMRLLPREAGRLWHLDTFGPSEWCLENHKERA